jgi:sec-independent protein translocase protein TatC
MSADSNLGQSLTSPKEFAGEDEDLRDDRSRMSFLEHLDELRRRIIYSLYALIGCCLVTFWYWDNLYRYFVTYFQKNGGQLIFTQPMSGFMFSLKISGLAGLIIASPFLFTQVWLFVAPGLYAKEKKLAVPFVMVSSLLFGAGAWFAHFIAFPMMWKFFASYELYGVKWLPTLDDTLSFYVKLILGAGAAFQMPLLVFVLARFGLVTAGFLARKFKWAILIIFIVAALITPTPDVFSQCVFAAPMLALYAVSIVVAWMFGKKKKTEDED